MNKDGSQLIRGLEGVVAAETKLCDLDGQHGRLAYAGYDIEDLARRASFEEVCHLLWHGDLPNAAQLASSRGSGAASSHGSSAAERATKRGTRNVPFASGLLPMNRFSPPE